MRHALNLMLNTNKYSHNSYVYEENKRKRSEAMQGKKHSNKTIQKMKEACKLRPKDYNLKMSEKTKGIRKTDEHKKKLSLAAKNEQKYKCKYCGNYFRKSALVRWHNNNCKERPGYVRPFNSNGHKGLKHSDETKRKISKTKRNKNAKIKETI